VTGLRHHLVKHRATAALVLLAALLMRLLVPAGYMPTFEGGTIGIVLCPSGTPGLAKVTAAAPMAMADAGHMAMAKSDHHSGQQQHDKPEPPCVFSGLVAPLLSGADPILLAGAILFVLATGLRLPVRQPVARPVRLRPPLRAPPIAPDRRAEHAAA
jgi:hypothetical protein